MLDIKFIRENPDAVRKAIQEKNVALDLDALLKLDAEVVELKKRAESLRQERNENARAVKKASADDRPNLIERGREIGKSIGAVEKDLKAREEEFRGLMWLTPNIPSSDAPVGPDESGNVEVKKQGELPEFDFEPRHHVDLLEKLDWADLKRVAKVAGSRSYALKGELASIELGLLNYAMAKLRKRGFTPLAVPALVREFTLFGSGHFPTGRDQVYYLEKDDTYLSGTAEVPINSLHSGEILDGQDLPLLYCGVSPCFRREAGSAGKDVRGLIRVHQFYKVEQFVICRNDPAESAKWHDELLSISENLVQDLELPYRVVEVCTGDMGAGKVRMHDIECWIPSEETYRETHSCSTLHDWQARRTNLRYRDAEGKIHFCHTLNNTALASPRILVPLLENHQQADGSVSLPGKLRQYLEAINAVD